MSAAKRSPAGEPGRALTAAETDDAKRCLRSLRQRKAEGFAEYDDDDFAAFVSQLEIVRVVHETPGTAPGSHHLHLDNVLHAHTSTPVGRLEIRDGTAVTLYENPDYGLLTEIRYAPYRGKEAPADPPCDPETLRNLLEA
ncbi:MAG: hypothetical protein ACYTGX_07000 [Planctomycetota bacterium]|jgi:hypothetical protein